MPRWLETLRKAVDPAGPLGAVLSPSDVYKERAGLPITSPHRQRVALEAPGHAQEAVAVAPARFVAAADAVDVPSDRVRQVSAFVEEVWAPEYAKTDSTDMLEILRASETLVGWNVTQRLAASAKARMTAEQYAEVLQTAQIQASDAIYDQYFETIVGNDPIEIDGKIFTGGTRIGSRNHYREATKDYIHWDAGYMAERQKAQADYATRPARNVRANLEATAGRVLPMRTVLNNPRFNKRVHS